MSGNEGTNGWDEHKRLIAQELKDLKAGQLSVNETLTSIQVSIAKLQVKSGVWGILGGSIPVALALGVLWVRSLVQ